MTYFTKYNSRKFITHQTIDTFERFVDLFGHEYKGTKKQREFQMRYDFARLESSATEL